MICLMNTARMTTDVAASPAVVHVSELSKCIDERQVLTHVNLDVRSGGFVSILGANGAGKSTLLKVLALLTPPTEGTLELFGMPAGRNGVAIRQLIGLLGHQSMLYRDLTARDNLLFFARLYSVSDAKQRVEQMLDRVSLSDRGDDAVKTFSRGMTQRLAIARALLHNPQLILADEPFAGLDLLAASRLERLLLDLQVEGKTVLMVNHDLEQSLRLSDRIVVLRGGTIVLDQPARDLDARTVAREVTGS
jgi:heme exporter protein A